MARMEARSAGDSVRRIKGVGSAISGTLTKLGIETVSDLLWHLPRSYEDRTTLRRIGDVEDGEAATVSGAVVAAGNERLPTGKVATKVVLDDGTGTVTLLWFNQWFQKGRFQKGQTISAYGTVRKNQWGTQIPNPEWEGLSDSLLQSSRITPVYPLTEGLSQAVLRKFIRSALEDYLPVADDPLPEEMRERVGLMGAAEAFREVHFPHSAEAVERARERLIFEELFYVQVAMALRRHRAQREPGIAFAVNRDSLDRFFKRLPFALTPAQKKVIGEIERDMAGPYPMNRLLQGDVGSGKTVVALTAMMIAFHNGCQAAMMAPTEILAEQHFLSLGQFIDGKSIRVELLTGSLTPKKAEAVRERIRTGESHLVVGTHALLQERVEFHRLGLVVIDEQHRFGVLQRANLRDKGRRPDLLVMTATPIPRTLALTVYGDLDVSRIQGMPPGRKAIRTYWKSAQGRQQIYEGIHALVKQGRQAYIVCPLIEESERLQAKAAVEMAERLRTEVFPDLAVGLLHGQMKAADKEAVMGRFRRGEIQILVATPVIEVGVDVPNASVILIEDAARFGLAQLHQLRGRVGRGREQSFCLLMADPKTEPGKQRLQAMVKHQDGFVLAEQDLKLRNTGDLWGVRQHGLPELKIADLLRDFDALDRAIAEARALVARDPELRSPECASLRRLVSETFHIDLALVN
ncbi:MAG: ATP-dependent DNA helicase RecG [Armatimonadetes bacterium]|nr:ATP-dependent DNA helicase RecG [Armatimonadota bacterium]